MRLLAQNRILLREHHGNKVGKTRASFGGDIRLGRQFFGRVLADDLVQIVPSLTGGAEQRSVV